jgi:hypothetical protein
MNFLKSFIAPSADAKDGESKAPTANLGGENTMYYCPERKSWVERGKEKEFDEARAKASAPPPSMPKYTGGPASKAASVDLKSVNARYVNPFAQLGLASNEPVKPAGDKPVFKFTAPEPIRPTMAQEPEGELHFSGEPGEPSQPPSIQEPTFTKTSPSIEPLSNQVEFTAEKKFTTDSFQERPFIEDDAFERTHEHEFIPDHTTQPTGETPPNFDFSYGYQQEHQQQMQQGFHQDSIPANHQSLMSPEQQAFNFPDESNFGPISETPVNESAVYQEEHAEQQEQPAIIPPVEQETIAASEYQAHLDYVQHYMLSEEIQDGMESLQYFLSLFDFNHHQLSLLSILAIRNSIYQAKNLVTFDLIQNIHQRIQACTEDAHDLKNSWLELLRDCLAIKPDLLTSDLVKAFEGSPSESQINCLAILHGITVNTVAVAHDDVWNQRFQNLQKILIF